MQIDCSPIECERSDLGGLQRASVRIRQKQDPLTLHATKAHLAYALRVCGEPHLGRCAHVYSSSTESRTQPPARGVA
jgi:hypothetical protein